MAEQTRLRELRAYDILDTPREPSFDRLSRMASQLLGTPIALVTLVDDERQWFKSAVGFDVTETSRAESFCAHAVADRAMLIVPDAALDPRFSDNPLVLGAPGIRFYAGAPLVTPGGFVLGTICGIDTVPRLEGLTDLQCQQLVDLAALAVDELELRRSVRLLAEQQRQLEFVTLATDAANDAIVITDASPIEGPFGPRIVYANQAFVTMSGYDRVEVIGNTPRMLQGPDTDRAALGRIREAIRAGRECREELLNYRKDGSTYWVELHIAPVVGSDTRAPRLIAVQRDITERRARDEQMREREHSYRLLFEHNPQCMLVFDADTGRFLDVNDAALALYGYSRDEFLARSVYDIRPAEDEAMFRQTLAALPEGQVYSGDWRHRRKDGTLLQARVQSFGTTRMRRRARLVLITDVTAERQLEERLSQAQKMEAVGALAGGIAHDFNNLLTVINGYNDLILGEVATDDPLREELEQVRRAGDRAAALTQQLLALSRRQVLQPKAVEPRALLEELRPKLSGMLRAGTTLSMVVPEGLPRIAVDPDQLALALLNLAANAADAMPEGGALAIECGEVTLDDPEAVSVDVRPGRYVLIAVSDSGPAMGPETLARIFEPFSTTRGKARGNGLGLPTAYGIVTQSDGHIVATSEPGRGTTFRVYLPLASDEVAVPQPAPTRSPRPGPRATQTILLVEDDEGVRRFATHILKAEGYDVLVAGDGPAALRLASDREGRIDLVLTDVVMPKMGGRQVADELRERHGIDCVVFMSGYGEKAIVLQGALETGRPFLPKPFTPGALLGKVREALDQQARTLTIVIADDDAPLRRLLAMTLGRAGYEVLEASHGRQALELCRQHPVDLLLTDLVMPEQEGLETIRELRAESPDVQIIAMSGAFGGTFLAVARRFGAGAVLQKPFDGRTVLDAVVSLIGTP